jgi:hypothetical protein
MKYRGSCVSGKNHAQDQSVKTCQNEAHSDDGRWTQAGSGATRFVRTLEETREDIYHLASRKEKYDGDEDPKSLEADVAYFGEVLGMDSHFSARGTKAATTGLSGAADRCPCTT